jgi:hypothetical protein
VSVSVQRMVTIYEDEDRYEITSNPCGCTGCINVAKYYAGARDATEFMVSLKAVPELAKALLQIAGVKA